jgi:signal transduction histidine kinase
MRARTAARLAWSMWSVTLALVAGSFVFLFLTRHTAVPAGGLGRSADVSFPIAFLVFSTVGAVVATRHPSNAIGWIFCASALSVGLWAFTHEYSIYGLLTNPGSLPGRDFMLSLETWAWTPGAQLMTTFLFLLFPTGRMPSPRWRIVAWVSVVALVVLAVGVAFDPGPLPDFPSMNNPYGVSSLRWANTAGSLIVLAAVLPSVASLIVRFRRSRGEERAQMKWFVLGAVVLIAVFIPAIIGPGRTPEFLTVLMGLALGLLAIATGIAILKYRLYDIDVVINKTVVYGLLAGFFTAVYVAIVVGIGAALGSRSNGVLTVASAVIIAVAFQPVRDRARRFANRLVYGDRATPYEALSEFSRWAAGGYSMDAALPELAKIVAQSTGASRAEVWLRVGSQLRRVAGWPATPAAAGTTFEVDDQEPSLPGMDRTYPVLHQGDLLGALAVSKPPADPLTPAEDKLLADLASQAGLLLRNAALIEDLRSSRQRIVSAQDAERRRLERNLHDGAQQQLVALSMKLGLAGAMMRKDPDQASQLLEDLQSESQEALANLRDLARGIYPPLLADQGLVAALESQSRKVGVPVAVEGDGVGRYAQDVEAAAYFCALEALQNVTKYAQASHIQVRLWEEKGELSFSVTDDGKGFDTAATSYGTGLQGMADRLAAQGGVLEVRSRPGEGTTVLGRLPADGRV